MVALGTHQVGQFDVIHDDPRRRLPILLAAADGQIADFVRLRRIALARAWKLGFRPMDLDFRLAQAAVRDRGEVERIVASRLGEPPFSRFADARGVDV